MAWRGYSVSFVLSMALMVAASANAEPGARPDPAGADELGLPTRAPRFELAWPLAPRRVSFTLASPITTADGVQQPFAAEVQWWSAGPVGLRSFETVAPSYELDCHVTCQPVLERTFGTEARVELGGAGVVPATQLFARSALVQVPPRSFSRFQIGLGGLLDL